jgi:hypothetical protein
MKGDDKNSRAYKLRFGEIAVMRGFLDESQLEEALEEKIGYKPIGEIVLERGWMTFEQIEEVLKEIDKGR